MWAPGLASIFARLILREGIADISLRVGGRRSLKKLPFVLLFPVFIGFVAYGIAWITGLVQYVTPETYIKAPPAVVFTALLLVQMVSRYRNGADRQPRRGIGLAGLYADTAD